MRLAFVDLYFCWPPHGGADVDLYHVIKGLQALGHQVKLFVASCASTWDRGSVEPSQLPFPATRLDFSPREIGPRTMPRRFRDAVDAWKPEVVFLTDGFFLKPYVAEALSHYPVISRYYAYELTCPRDLRLLRDGARCPDNYLRTPNICRPCALAGMAADIKQWRFLPWAEEYVAARAYLPSYHALVLRTLRHFSIVIASNRLHKRQMDPFNDDVRIVPGGVDVATFVVHPPPKRRSDERKVILTTGRGEDPAKGVHTLREAGALLARERNDFVIRVTHTDYTLNTDWFQAIGWHDRDAVARLYQQADVCVVPSIWEEPFGLVAVEAMASGRPVCASRVGGLQDIVVHGETGFLCAPGDSAELARRLAQLLDDDGLRRRMGDAGRRRAESEYDWEPLVRKHYPPLLEKVAR